MDATEKKAFVEWIEDNGGEGGALYMTFPEEKLEKIFLTAYERGKENARLESQVEQLQKINSEQKEMLKKVRIALIQERTANLMNYGKGGVEIFDSILRRVKEND